jgi:hypothetical protein
LIMGFKGSEGMMVGGHVVPNIRELVEGNADVCDLQAVEFTDMTPNAGILICVHSC